MTDYARDGIEILPTPLAPMLVADLKLEGQKLAMCRHRDPLPDDIARAHKTENGWRINVIPARVKRDQLALIRSARSVVAGISMKATEYLGPGWGVSSYIWDYSGPTKENQFPHHVDTFYGFKALKVYVFLTDCGQLNGALEYAAGIHESVRVLMNSKYQHSFPPTLEEDNSFENVERLYGYRLNRPSYLNGVAGTVVLFDPAGPHGSGPVRHGERYIFRAHLVERAYVLRHLPDQLPWYLKPVNRVMGWTKKTSS